MPNQNTRVFCLAQQYGTWVKVYFTYLGKGCLCSCVVIVAGGLVNYRLKFCVVSTTLVEQQIGVCTRFLVPSANVLL